MAHSNSASPTFYSQDILMALGNSYSASVLHRVSPVLSLLTTVPSILHRMTSSLTNQAKPRIRVIGTLLLFEDQLFHLSFIIFGDSLSAFFSVFYRAFPLSQFKGTIIINKKSNNETLLSQVRFCCTNSICRGKVIELSTTHICQSVSINVFICSLIIHFVAKNKLFTFHSL